MFRVYLVSYIVLMIVFGNWCSDSFKQQGARLKIVNPKFMSNASVFTGRKSRRDPYLTNMTGTLLMPYGNNVTFATTLTLTSGGDFRIVAKACETTKTKWMNEFMSSFTDLPLDKCPFPAGTYSFFNMELPPKDIPIPLADGDYYIKVELYVTASRETIAVVDMLLHYDQSTRRANTKKKG